MPRPGSTKHENEKHAKRTMARDLRCSIWRPAISRLGLISDLPTLVKSLLLTLPITYTKDRVCAKYTTVL